MSVSHEKGAQLEAEVAALLAPLKSRFSQRVLFAKTPTIRLQTGETVVPDFDFVYRLPQSNEFFFIECQDRQRTSKALLYKISFIRSKYWRKSFIVVFRENIDAPTQKALVNEGVVVLSLQEFSVFLERVAATLQETQALYHELFPTACDKLLPTAGVDIPIVDHSQVERVPLEERSATPPADEGVGLRYHVSLNGFIGLGLMVLFFALLKWCG